MSTQRLVTRAVLVLLLTVISALFLWMIAPFLMAIFLAALFAALFTPVYQTILGWVNGRAVLASLLTLLVAVSFVFIPFILIFGAVASQALEVAQNSRPWIQEQMSSSGDLALRLKDLPFYEIIEPYRDTIISRLGELASTMSGWTVNALQSATLGTVSALVTIVIILYTMFFFLMTGDRLLFQILYYLPLQDEEEAKLLGRFMSVTRATLKGTAVIGLLQGCLAGLALWLAGIPTALFWTVVMVLLSVVPGIGTALVWVPASIYLAIRGEYAVAIGVVAFCAVVVGTVDNVVRPKLVGSDTRLHELMIFFSTLGGLLMFGFMGFVIGPIIAALFVTIWELYGHEFRDYLPFTAFRPRSGPVQWPHEQFDEPVDNDVMEYFDGDKRDDSRFDEQGRRKTEQ